MPQLRHESRLFVSADFLEEVMGSASRNAVYGRWDEDRSIQMNFCARQLNGLSFTHHNSRVLLDLRM